MIFPLLFQSTEEESSSERAPSTGHASEDQESRWRDVHGERSRETRTQWKQSENMVEMREDREEQREVVKFTKTEQMKSEAAIVKQGTVSQGLFGFLKSLGD